MATDVLTRISNDICSDYLGFSPATNATKPPHIANGLFRNCIGETCDTRDVHEWIISDGRKDAVPSEEIIARYQDILQNGYQETIVLLLRQLAVMKFKQFLLMKSMLRLMSR